MFTAVNEWANMNFGSSKFKMIAYNRTRHDSAAVWDYLNKNQFCHPSEPNKTLHTAWWHQWWNERPSSDEAEFLYYKDETMTSQYGNVYPDRVDGTQNIGSADAVVDNHPAYDYASREYLNSRHYYIVEERNNTNE